MPIRTVPMNRPPSPDLPEIISPNDVADRLGMHPDTVGRGIREDMEDSGKRIPGGRCIGSRYFVIRAVFERAMRQGIEPEARTRASRRMHWNW
jgi:hypothetical protein